MKLLQICFMNIDYEPKKWTIFCSISDRAYGGQGHCVECSILDFTDETVQKLAAPPHILKWMSLEYNLLLSLLGEIVTEEQDLKLVEEGKLSDLANGNTA